MEGSLWKEGSEVGHRVLIRDVSFASQWCKSYCVLSTNYSLNMSVCVCFRLNLCLSVSSSVPPTSLFSLLSQSLSVFVWVSLSLYPTFHSSTLLILALGYFYVAKTGLKLMGIFLKQHPMSRLVLPHLATVFSC